MNAEVASQEYEASTDRAHRARFGQFFTPSVLAEFMIKWVLDKNPKELFDPAIGTGSFQAAASRLRPGIKLLGCEKDPLVRAYFQRSSSSYPTDIVGADFFHLPRRQFASIVCNPPYLRFQNFEGRHQVGELLSEIFGVEFSGLLNASSAFLLRALADLKPGGRLAFLMPLEFLASGYGTKVKQVLLDNSSYLHFIRISGEKEVFPGATTSVGIVFLEKARSVTGNVHFSELASLQDAKQELHQVSSIQRPKLSLNTEDKWYSCFSNTGRTACDSQVRLTTYGRFSRGIATGANEFFVLRPSEWRALNLAPATRQICITRSQQLRGSTLSQDSLDALIASDEPVILLDLCASDSQAARKKITDGELQGFSSRYLTRQRTPWYRLESRSPPQILFGVFSRGGFKVVRNTTSAISLTPFHGFTPKVGFEKYVDFIWLFLSSRAGQEALQSEKRIYGGKLDKFEPNDLNKVSLPSPDAFDTIEPDLIFHGSRALASGGELPQKLQNAFFMIANSA